jgi:hypothetical protein
MSRDPDRRTSVHIALQALAFALAVIVTPASACRRSDEDVANGGDPIAALRAATPSTRYTATFWKAAADRDSVLWNRAVALCAAAEATQRPNCVDVRLVQGLREGSRVPPRRPEQHLRF